MNKVLPLFRNGDEVIVHKPQNIHESPVWTPSMDVFDGKIMEVDKPGAFSSRLVGTRFSFNNSWLEFVSEDLQNTTFDIDELM